MRVVTPAGASATGPASRFTYRRPPVVSSVAPDGGPNTGGTVVTITGARFAGASKVRFDNTAATSFTVVSPTEIRAVSPPMPDTGAVAVVVETPGGSGYLSAAFGYIPAGPGPAWAEVVPSLDYSCGLTRAGAVYCWGSGSYYQQFVPLPIDGMSSGVTDITAAYGRACAVKNGAAYCWSSSEWYPALGFPRAEWVEEQPHQVTGMAAGVSEIVTSGNHTCAIKSGRAYCWGENGSGEISGPIGGQSVTPREVPGLTSVTRVAMNGADTESGTTCAVADSALWCWGDNAWFQRGSTDTSPTGTPTRVSGMGSGVSDVALHDIGYATCAVRNGGAWCWGNNSSYTLADPDVTLRTATPRPIPTLAGGLARIEVGHGQACARKTAGPLVCWGANYDGVVGNGTAEAAITPTPVVDIGDAVTSVVAANYVTCAVHDEQAYCWGQNMHGALGTYVNHHRWVPNPRPLRVVPPA